VVAYAAATPICKASTRVSAERVRPDLLAEHNENADQEYDRAYFFKYLRNDEPELFEQLNDGQRRLADDWVW
jgi:hypothetical protein